jgi:hypothetical protein
MRDSLNRHDHREIAVSTETRSARPGAAPRRSPAPRAAARGPGEWRAAFGAVAGGVGRLCLTRPGEVVGSILAIGAVGLVSMNALGSQGGRHPAPIFTGGASAASKAPGRSTEVKTVAEKPAEAAAAAPVREPPKPIPTAETRPDPIAEIIRTADSTASVTPKAVGRVAEAQRALVKLGYGPLQADGVMGPGTRAAIERFERDRKLPVKGEAGGRTLKELATRAAAPRG